MCVDSARVDSARVDSARVDSARVDSARVDSATESDSSLGADGAHALDASVADGASERIDGQTPSGDPRATTASGDLVGRRVGGTNVFLGVPYAEPPVGPRRFAHPVPIGTWSGVRDARTPAPACIQAAADATSFRTHEPLEQSEDCLTMNIYAPVGAQSAPVLVFIHGGGGTTGAASDYDGRHLSEGQNLVVITIQYRLSFLASFIHPELDEELGAPAGNLGLRDQQLALTWIQNNIGAFGGDPESVTLMGQSHGASCTCMHMFARGSETLAQRFIMQSGGCVGSAVMPGTRAGMLAQSEELAAALCSTPTGPRADVLACMRELDPSVIASWVRPGTNTSIRDAQGIYVDGELIPRSPHELLATGEYHRAPILVGSNLRETHFLESEYFRGQNEWPLVADPISLSLALSVMYREDWPAILLQYGLPATNEAANLVMVRTMDESWMQCPHRVLALGASELGERVYQYRFDLAPAVHTLELDYVLGDPEAPLSKLFEGAPVPLEPGLVELIQGYWGRFVRTGDPNGDGAPEWPPFDANDDRSLILDRSVTVASRLYATECEFWQTTTAGSR